MRDSVLERVRGLSANAQAVAEAAAVLQMGVPVPVLVATCRVPKQDAHEGLDELLDRGLFVERGGTAGFRHALAVQAVHGSIPLSRRQDLHARAATAVAGQRPTPLGQIAHHRRHAGHHDAWVDAAEKAADQAVALANDAEAERLLEAVLRHVPRQPAEEGGDAPLDPAREGRLAAKLGWAGGYALAADELVGLLRGAADRQPPGPVRGELKYLIGLKLEAAGAPRRPCPPAPPPGRCPASTAPRWRSTRPRRTTSGPPCAGRRPRRRRRCPAASARSGWTPGSRPTLPRACR
ncbi:hypothetical protein [Streptosporangium sp. CA-115845]|uniref:hypothetical protein n=1 Tax=Streptosporangium sp. CA-115845 TaxID=3240071 RepID=UPI003D8F9D55